MIIFHDHLFLALQPRLKRNNSKIWENLNNRSPRVAPREQLEFEALIYVKTKSVQKNARTIGHIY